MISLSYRANTCNSKKIKDKKSNFLSYFLAIGCVTTLPDIPADKKRHYPNGTISPSKFINRYKFLEEYYDGMPACDIVNRNAQFTLGIKETV